MTESALARLMSSRVLRVSREGREETTRSLSSPVEMRYVVLVEGSVYVVRSRMRAVWGVDVARRVEELLGRVSSCEGEAEEELLPGAERGQSPS